MATQPELNQTRRHVSGSGQAGRGQYCFIPGSNLQMNIQDVTAGNMQSDPALCSKAWLPNQTQLHVSGSSRVGHLKTIKGLWPGSGWLVGPSCVGHSAVIACTIHTESVAGESYISSTELHMSGVKMLRSAEITDRYQLFNPQAYLQNNYTHPRANFDSEDCVVPWKLRCFASSFSTGEIRGQTLLDIGSGPTLYQVISACDFFNKIVMSDYLEVNREELWKWLRGDAGAFNWTPYIKYVCGLEGKSDHWEEKERRLRETIKDVCHCDIMQPNPLHPQVLDPVDAISTTFCLESVCPDKKSLEKALGNITSLLKPGGFLLMIGALDESYYLAGEVKLSVVPLDEDYVKEAVSKSGYRICVFKTYNMPPELKIGVDDVRGVFYLQAQKI
ncbi:phenylethanolamine N-methyltransferase-like [Heterodontus francisci]|uniref:phenylethanolamine N-methyltransferase-like n=1 Tax=Heterodontus francisci TaxID=7792 RepID=UPI00355B03FB